MASSVHPRGHMNAPPSSFITNGATPQHSHYATGPTTSNISSAQQSHLPPRVAFSPQLPTSNAPQSDKSITNKRATENISLYHICLNLRRRLTTVPGFMHHIAEMEEEEAEADDSTEPVTSMWNCFRRGYPLMTIYNALKPKVPLHIDPSRIAESKYGKAATFKFLQACLTDLAFPANECFLITDLYGGDTTGFVKVTKVVNRVLDILSNKGLLLPEEHIQTSVDRLEPLVKNDKNIPHKHFVIDEIVRTERDYVQHLEILQDFKNEVEESGAIAGDAVHDIFLNLNALLDFQRRFLIRIEQQNSLPEDQQNWGQLFIQYKESFRVYEPFIANQIRCNNAVTKEWDKLKAAPLSEDLRGMVEIQSILTGFLMKPFQRLSKYPMLLDDLRTKGDLSEEMNEALAEGSRAASSILHRANDAIDKEHRLEAVAELQSRVEDWKGHKIDHFGDLLLHGNFTVLKGEGAKEVEREVGILDSFPPRLYAAFLNAVKQEQLKLGSPTTRRHKLGNLSPGMLFPQEDSSFPIRFVTSLEDVSEEISEGRRSIENSYDASEHTSPSSPITQSMAKQIRKMRSMPSCLGRRKIGRNSPPTSPSTPTSAFTSASASPISIAFSRDGSGAEVGSMSPTPSRRGKLRFGSAHSESRPKFKPNGKKAKIRRSFGRYLGFPLMSHPGPRLFEFNSCLKMAECFPFFHHLSAELSPRELRTLNLKKHADKMGIRAPARVQYKVYLFERILLCCKEINPNKPKNKMLGNNKPPLDKKGKPRLQLKGRIFMQNVTDVVSLGHKDKPTYTIQIFWKGDPGVENFVIRFANKDLMLKWREQVQQQKKTLSDSARSSGQTGTSETEFTFLKNQGLFENPYLQDDDGEEDDNRTGMGPPGQSLFNMSRNTSSTSLRSNTPHSSTGLHSIDRTTGRSAPPRFPLPEQASGPNAPLTLNTNFAQGADSPGEINANSYFSPTADSPMSTRSSSQANMYPFPRQATPVGGWPHEDHKHRTAPAMGRAPSRDGSTPLNGYTINGRTRPSLPVMATAQNPQHSATMQSRLRSASTPDIHNSNAAATRRYANGQPSIDNVPVPPIPQHVAQMRAPISRSQTSSPAMNPLPTRSATQSPQLQRDRAQRQVPDDTDSEIYYRMRQQQRAETESREVYRDEHEGAPSAPVHPQLLPVATHDIAYPTQLKVKIYFDPAPSHVTIVVPIVIKHRSLVDRIDSKMVKISSASISKGTARLRYKDMDGDKVCIDSDDDVQLAIEDWGTVHAKQLAEGIVSDFELQWQEVPG